MLLWDRKHPCKAATKLAGHKAFITALRFTRNGDRLLSASTDLTARIWSTGDGALLTEIKGGHTGYLASAAFDRDGRLVATASADRTIRLWDAGTGVEKVTLRRHSETVNSVAFSPKDNKILSASDDGTVKLGECSVSLMPLDKLKEQLRNFAGEGKVDDIAARKEGVLSLIGKTLKTVLSTVTR